MQLPVEGYRSRRGRGGGRRRLHGLFEKSKKVSRIEVGLALCLRACVCLCLHLCEVRSIPRGGGGGGGRCEEAVYEEYNGLRQTRKGHKKFFETSWTACTVGVCPWTVSAHVREC